jgi:photosystem II stability/assembly factor-like uncharacterized protein
MPKTTILVGTRKGAFLVDPDRGAEGISGPHCETMPLQHLTWDAASRTLFGAAGSPWFGPTVWRSTDLGRTWAQSSDGLTYGPAEPAVTRVWNITPVRGVLYAGVEPAGLFRSDDGGVSWAHVAGLREHPSRPTWEPGAGGLILHSIVPHATDPQRMWIAISAVGTFHTRDGGRSWVAQNRGIRAIDAPPDAVPETGYCVHKLVNHPDRPEVLFQQNHVGVYRSDDGGDSWIEITGPLPSTFGFPMVIHPHRPSSAYTIPLNGDQLGRYAPDGRLAVWRTEDDGASWMRLSAGLPEHAWVGVLREAMATDRGDPAGIWFGTSTGQLYGSRDDGDTWSLIADHLPGIASVETADLSAA